MKDIEKEIINFSKNLSEKDIENGCQENINNFLEKIANGQIPYGYSLTMPKKED